MIHVGDLSTSDISMSFKIGLHNEQTFTLTMKSRFIKLVVIFACLACCFPFISAQADDPLRSSIRLQTDVGHDAVKSQQQIDRLFDDKQRLLDEYKQTTSELQSLQRYNDHLQKMVSAQAQTVASLQQQMDDIDVTHREVIPLMLRMLETLQQFIELDVPFLLNERRQRVRRLQGLLDRPDLSVAEKYRQVMEAYQIETEYGRTVETYRAILDQSDGIRTVDFLRIGRLALIYRTLDGSDSGVWNQKNKSWQPLPGDYQRSLTQGFRIAKKQMAPDMLKLPVPAPEVLKTITGS